MITAAVERLPLTPRQAQIVQLIAAGCTTEQVSGQLGISSVTLRTHLRNIFTRLSVSGRFQIVSAVIAEALNVVADRAELEWCNGFRVGSRVRIKAGERMLGLVGIVQPEQNPAQGLVAVLVQGQLAHFPPQDLASTDLQEGDEKPCAADAG
jgi:DNA-binding CsgD family transcriptional regulator